MLGNHDSARADHKAPYVASRHDSLDYCLCVPRGVRLFKRKHHGRGRRRGASGQWQRRRKVLRRSLLRRRLEMHQRHLEQLRCLPRGHGGGHGRRTWDRLQGMRVIVLVCGGFGELLFVLDVRERDLPLERVHGRREHGMPCL